MRKSIDHSLLMSIKWAVSLSVLRLILDVMGSGPSQTQVFGASVTGTLHDILFNSAFHTKYVICSIGKLPCNIPANLHNPISRTLPLRPEVLNHLGVFFFFLDSSIMREHFLYIPCAFHPPAK